MREFFPKIGICSDALWQGWRRLWGALSSGLPVEVERVTDPQSGIWDALIGEDLEAVGRVGEGRGALDWLILKGAGRPIRSLGGRVEFSKSEALVAELRGRSDADRVPLLGEPFDFNGWEVLARKGEHCVWGGRKSGGRWVEVVVGRMEELPRGRSLDSLFEEGSCAVLMPVLNLVRRVLDRKGWQANGLRACLMFDDPNLHWPTYGHLDFRHLAVDARERRYHVTFATVPADGWWVNEAAARIFRENPGQLSLLIHGNNHVKNEMVSLLGEAEQDAFFAHALARIQSIEERARLAVDRLVAPPHSACSEGMMRGMSRAGLDGLCIAPEDLEKNIPDSTWVRDVGVGMADWVDNLPVVMRFKMGRNWRRQVLLSALLGRPCIVYGHQMDLSGGSTILADVVSEVSGYPDVHWMPSGAIVRSNYWRRGWGERLDVWGFGVRLNLPATQRERFVRIEMGPAERRGEASALRVRGNGEAGWQSVEGGEILGWRGEGAMEIERVNPRPAGKIGKMPKTGPWAVIRRQVVEIRDRLSALV